MYHSRSQVAASRRGVILLVVVSLLTLFAIVGLSFVMYAESEAKGAQAHREAGVLSYSEVNPEMLLGHFLEQLIYDVPDNEVGVFSALRGHSLLRTMYGLNYEILNDGTLRRNAAGQLVVGAGAGVVANPSPFSGPGRLHNLLTDLALPPSLMNQDEYPLINYMYFRNDGFLRDPERPGIRTALRAPGQPDNRRPYRGGFNVSYTYPDLNNMFLAAMNADGRVLTPSFHRDWHFGPLDKYDPNDLNVNPNWRNQIGKYMTLRPRPIDMGAGFPYPEDAGGDVKNLLGTPGGNDSIWIDLGFPVHVTPEGKMYKPLFAPLIVDLDNRVNVNVHGNIRGADRTHATNQGWGRWEVDLSKVITARDTTDPNRDEWGNLFTGNPSHPARPQGRYGSVVAAQPMSPVARRLPGTPTFYGRYDFDGTDEGNARQPSSRWLPPPSDGLRFSPFPTFAGGYGSGSTAESPVTGNAANPNHPYRYNPMVPAQGNRAYGISNMEALLRYQDTNSPALTSELYRTCPNSFLNPKTRNLVTTHSFDFDHVGLTPWVRDVRSNIPAEQYTLTSNYPRGQSIPFPAPGTPLNANWSEFNAQWRAVLPQLGRRLDLNRSLPPYPQPPVPPNDNGRIANADINNYNAALNARQMFAREIYQLLIKATGAYNPFLFVERGPGELPPPAQRAQYHTRPPTPEEFQALRWLAQLAVNIVDYIDPDDYMTPFNWGAVGSTGTEIPQPNWRGFTNRVGNEYRFEWVYGTELPRVVLNEVYAEYRRTGPDNIRFDVWSELHNTFHDDINLADGRGNVRLYVPPGNGQPEYSTYQVILAKEDPWRRTPPVQNPDPLYFSNVRGDLERDEIHEVAPGSGERCEVKDADFNAVPATTTVLRKATTDGAFFGPNAGNQGFYVLGSNSEQFPDVRLTSTLPHHKMSYELELNNPPTVRNLPTVVLRRLACPHLQPNPMPGEVGHRPTWPVNPYVTVDYVDMHGIAGVRVFNAGPAGDPADQRVSYGRRQPYAAHFSQFMRQLPTDQQANTALHTFFRHNAREAAAPINAQDPRQTLQHPFDWLVHLDRQLINPMELLHVSAVRPTDLTQRFMDGNRFNHYAPWGDQSARIYRLFEFIETHDRAAGMQTVNNVTAIQHIYDRGALQKIVPTAMHGNTSTGVPWSIINGSVLIVGNGANEEVVVAQVPPNPNDQTSFMTPRMLKPHGPGTPITLTLKGDRVPGKINLNNVWDVETFRALCASVGANGFTDQDVEDIFTRLIASRSPGGVPGPTDQARAGYPLNRPFRTMATGWTEAGAQYPEGVGIGDTYLRPGLFDVPRATHPYRQKELLTKIFNNLTTRSNVFAVWLTVGFFEVTDPTARPVKLGAEIGKSENKHVRHRMFSIVDRTQSAMANRGTATPPPRTSPIEVQGGGQPEWIRPVGGMLNIHPGTNLIIDHYDDTLVPPRFVGQETVRVLEVDPQDGSPPVVAFRANFQGYHPAGFRIRFSYATPGAPAYNNPGPGPITHARHLPTALVPYYSVIH